MGELGMKVKSTSADKGYKLLYTSIVSARRQKSSLLSASSNLMIMQTIAKHDLRIEKSLSPLDNHLSYNLLSRCANKSSLSELFRTECGGEKKQNREKEK